MSNFTQTGLPCDDCGSSDALAINTDGWSTCFSCDVRKPPQGNRPLTFRKEARHIQTPDLSRYVQQWASAQPQSIPDRCISAAAVKHYGVVVQGDGTHLYPYFKEDHHEPAGFKIRGPNKAFRAVGDTKDTGLFGQHKYGNHQRNRIVVTEGELDAMAAWQILQGKVPVVSLRSGASGAGRDFKASYEFLDGFEEIILCFDADEAGKAAVEKAADVFAGKLRVMKLDPKQGKDANDYLKAGLTKEFSDLYWSASQYTPKGVLSVEELWERLNTDKPAALGDWPWQKLNDLTFGFRPTELVTITAGSGLGKSSILRELVMHIRQTTDNKIGCLFMEESVERTAEGFMGVDLSTPVHLPTSSVKRGDEAYRASFERVFGDGQLMIMDASFDTGATVDQVVARVRFLAKALDCKVVVLDHISILVSAGQHGDERRALDEIMTKLRTLTQDTGIVLFAVSHLKRPEGKGHEEGAATSLSQLRGSAAIAQLSDFVIGLERNGQADNLIERNTTSVRVLKNRFSGITGPAGHLLYDNATGRLSEYEPVEAEEEAL